MSCKSLLFWAAIMSAAAPEALSATVADWRQDIDQIVRDVRLTHPDPFFATGPTTFLQGAEALKRDLPRLSEEQRMTRLMALVASLGDGHTSLEPDREDFANWYPVHVYEFADGYFITAAHRSAADLVGAQVIEIAGRPVAEVAEAARDLFGADNPSQRKERLYALHNGSLMKGLGYARPDGSLDFKVRLASGRVVQRTLQSRPGDNDFLKQFRSTYIWPDFLEMAATPVGQFAEWTTAYKGLPPQAFRTRDDARPPHLVHRRTLASKALPEKDAYYVQLNWVFDTPQETMAAFFERVMREMEAQKPKRLIVDLRYNAGGDGSRLRGMLDEFVKARRSPPWQELYLLTGRRTFSAGVMAADVVIDNADPTIVGEPTASALNHFGDANRNSYARVGAYMYLSTLRHQLSTSDDLDDFIRPDVPAEFTFADWSMGRDPAVDPILDGKEMRGLSAIALKDGGAAARRVLNERRAAYAGHGWWSPPPEEAINRLGNTLLEAKRVADALEIFTLYTETYPASWNAWEDLGKTQIEAGRKEEGLRSYKCAMAINPGNYERGEIEQALKQSGVSETLPLPDGCGARPGAGT